MQSKTDPNFTLARTAATTLVFWRKRDLSPIWKIRKFVLIYENKLSKLNFFTIPIHNFVHFFGFILIR